MSLKLYLFIMTSSTLICWAIFALILKSINPETTSWIGFAFFYSTLALSVWGAACLIGFIIRFVFLKQTLAFRAMQESFRQAFFFTFLIIIALALLSQNLLSWLNIVLLIVGLTLLEFVILGYSHKSLNSNQ